MRNRFFFFTFFAFSLLFLGCSEDGTNPTPQVKSAMQAKVDNKDWAANKITSSINTGSNNFLLVVGTYGNTEINISVPGVSGTGTFSNTTEALVSGKFEDRGQAEYWTSTFGGNCTITITKFDQKAQVLSGTFNFNGENLNGTSSKDITGGTFTDVPYMVY